MPEITRDLAEATDRTWLQCFYFFDPAGIMQAFCGTANEGSADVDFAAIADGFDANGQPTTGA